MADVPLLVAGTASVPLTYTVPNAQEIIPRGARAIFDGSGAFGDFVPALEILSDAGLPLAFAILDDKVAAGASADVSWFPRLRPKIVSAQQQFVLNVGMIGSTIDTFFAGSTAMHLQFEDVQVGDGILVLTMAPSNPGGGDPIGVPSFVDDNFGNTYTKLSEHLFEASPPGVNTGVHAAFWFCASSVALMEQPFDVINGHWDQSVFDRTMVAWRIVHDGGANTPVLLAATPDNDATVFAATDVTLTTGDWTPPRDEGLELAVIITAKVGGTGGFSSVAGFDGFVQVISLNPGGAKQTYHIAPQTFEANAVVVNTPGTSPWEYDQGLLPAGVDVPPFNGVGQNFASGASAWKGIVLFGIG